MSCIPQLKQKLKLGLRSRLNNKILDLIQALENHPKKGKLLGPVGGIILKELKYKNFRFYFITDGFKLKALTANNLVDLLLRFVRMSEKKQQQQVINEIKHILKVFGSDGFN